METSTQLWDAGNHVRKISTFLGENPLNFVLWERQRAPISQCKKEVSMYDGGTGYPVSGKEHLPYIGGEGKLLMNTPNRHVGQPYQWE